MERNRNNMQRANGNLRRRKRRRSRKRRRFRIDRIILIIAVIVFCFSAFSLVKIALGYKKGTDTYNEIEEKFVKEYPLTEEKSEEANEDTTSGQSEAITLPYIDLNELQNYNPDANGWILIPDTQINYPIVHGSDNAYYLNHMIDGTENGAGTLFVDTNNAKDFSDKNTIIYGHNMKNGSMFGQLKKYVKEDFFLEHPYIYLYMSEGVYRYDIFSVRVVPEVDQAYTISFDSPEKWRDYLREAYRKSYHKAGSMAESEDKIITLSTCTNDDTQRLIIQAVQCEKIQ